MSVVPSDDWSPGFRGYAKFGDRATYGLGAISVLKCTHTHTHTHTRRLIYMIMVIIIIIIPATFTSTSYSF